MLDIIAGKMLRLNLLSFQLFGLDWLVIVLSMETNQIWVSWNRKESNWNNLITSMKSIIVLHYSNLKIEDIDYRRAKDNNNE